MIKFPISTIWRNHLSFNQYIAVSDGELFNISSIQKKHEENIKWEIIVLYSQIFFLEMLEIA